MRGVAVLAVLLALAPPAQAGQNDRTRRSAGGGGHRHHDSGDDWGSCCLAMCDMLEFVDWVASTPPGPVVVIAPPPRTAPPPAPPPTPPPAVEAAPPTADFAPPAEEFAPPPDDLPPPEAALPPAEAGAPPAAVPPPPAGVPPVPAAPPPGWVPMPRYDPNARPAPPPPPPPPADENEFGLALGIQAVVGTENPILAPRFALHAELPTESGGGRLRFDADQVLFSEALPATLESPARWDVMPLTTLRVSWLDGDEGWKAGGGAGLALLDIGRAGFAAGLDLALLARAEAQWAFFDASGRLVLFENLFAFEGRVGAGLKLGPVRLALAWRHLAFLDDFGPIPYGGPELTAGVAF